MSNPYNYTLPQTQNLNAVNTNSLPTWAWILIAIGVVLFLILIIALIIYVVRGNKKTVTATKIVQAPIIDPLKMSGDYE